MHLSLAIDRKKEPERPRPTNYQRKRDDNKNKICAFQGGLGREAGRKIVQNAIFHGKRHDNKILKVKILLSSNFVVMAQAPKLARLGLTGKLLLGNAKIDSEIFFCTKIRTSHAMLGGPS